MPYITQEKRAELEHVIGQLEEYNLDCGEMNYIVTRLCNSFVRRLGKRYSVINEVIGVLECAKQEFYRRVASPYEDEKRETNGDVY
jgi:hypothetical protein